MNAKATILGFFLIAGLSLSAQDAAKKYGIKSAIIKKETTVGNQKIESTLFFDDYGKKEATELNIKMGAMEKHTLTIAEDSTIVSYDLEEKKGFRMVKPVEPQNFLQLSPEDIAKFKIKEVGEEEIAGKPCKKYTMIVTQQGQHLGITTWVWQGITLKQEAGGGGTIFMTDEAKEVEENAAIPADKFILPEGVEITEQPN